jgi:hypothetical protein
MTGNVDDDSSLTLPNIVPFPRKHFGDEAIDRTCVPVQFVKQLRRQCGLCMFVVLVINSSYELLRKRRRTNDPKIERSGDEAQDDEDQS